MSPKAGCWWLMPVILATWKAHIRRNGVRPYLESYLVENRARRDVPVVAHLRNKHEALSSKPSTTKKERKKDRKEERKEERKKKECH
jgi:hypothetical protein